MAKHPSEHDTGEYSGSKAPMPAGLMSDDELKECGCPSCKRTLRIRRQAALSTASKQEAR